MLLKLLRPSKSSTRPIPKGVAELYKSDINGTDQWLLARGNSKDLPVLLMLHGGPGFTDMWLSETCNQELEKQFIVVNWDQRGAGKSFDKKADPKLLTIAQFIDDAKTVVDHLLTKFGKEKIYLLGHSWGSVLGWKLAQEIPEKLQHYIGVAQITDMQKSESLSYQFTLEAARKDGNEKAVRELENLTMPAPDDGRNPLKPMMLQRKWLAWYGGMMQGEKKLSAISKHMMGAKEYSFADMLRFDKGMKLTTAEMWHQLLRLNFFNRAASVSIPITLIVGKHDMAVNPQLTKEFFEHLNSPNKRFIELEAAHLMFLTQTGNFSQAIIDCKGAE